MSDEHDLLLARLRSDVVKSKEQVTDMYDQAVDFEPMDEETVTVRPVVTATTTTTKPMPVKEENDDDEESNARTLERCCRAKTVSRKCSGEVCMRVDRRESAVLEVLEHNGTPFYSDTLTLGDFCWCIDGVPLLLAERKTAADLQASLQDGRWHDQCARLQQNGVPFFYIIEGLSVNTTVQHGGAIASMIVRECVSVLHTRTPGDTASLLFRISRGLPKWQKRDAEEASARWTQARAHRCGITGSLTREEKQDDCLARMLCQVRGVSSTMARRIADKYRSMSVLLAALTDRVNALPSGKKESKASRVADALSNELDTGHHPRRVGPVIAERIWTTLTVGSSKRSEKKKRDTTDEFDRKHHLPKKTKAHDANDE